MSAQKGAYAVDLAAVSGNGGVASIANPEGADLYITRVILHVVTPSAGAATVDAGIAANGTTSSDNLIDGKTVATAGVFDNLIDGGSNGKAGQKWASGQYLTTTQASGDVTGLVGQILIEYVRL